MKKEVIRLLEEKVNMKFEGKTGKDLYEFLVKNQTLLLNDYINLTCLMSDEFSSPDKYYISMDSSVASILDSLAYEETVSMDDNVYKTVEEMISAGDDIPMVYGYLDSEKKYNGFYEMVKFLHQVCKENNAKALLEFENPLGDIDLSIKFNNDKINYNGTICIIDDSGDMLLQSLLWIAYRLNKGNINDYLSLFEVKITSQDKDNSINLNKNAVLENKNQIIDQINKTPISILNYVNSIPFDEDLIIAFIQSNDKYVKNIINDSFRSDGLKVFYQSFYKEKANEFLNGIPNFTEEQSRVLFDQKYLLSHLNVLEELSKTSMIKDLYITKDHIALFEDLFKNYPSLIIPITLYYEKEFESDKKAKENFLMTRKLPEKISVFNLSVLKSIELINTNNSDGYSYLLDRNFEYYDTAIKYCEDLPLSIKRKIIEKNYYLMKYFKNDFSFDDELVLKIIKNCPSASLLVSDEAVIKYNLKQSEKNSCLSCKCK